MIDPYSITIVHVKIPCSPLLSEVPLICNKYQQNNHVQYKYCHHLQFLIFSAIQKKQKKTKQEMTTKKRYKSGMEKPHRSETGYFRRY